MASRVPGTYNPGERRGAEPMTMSADPQASGPNPGDILSAFTAFHRSGALKAAVELDLFSAIAAGAQTVDALAQRCGAAPRGIRILADYLGVNGFLIKEGGGAS